jgi:hypothetical protein
MSKRVSNKHSALRPGKKSARSKVRLGWRKLKRIAMIDALREAVLLNAAGVVPGRGDE